MGVKNIYKFRPNVDVGSLDAESDKFLLKAFVEKEEMKLLEDIDNRKSIILGRTGSGKTALIMKLEDRAEQ